LAGGNIKIDFQTGNLWRCFGKLGRIQTIGTEIKSVIANCFFFGCLHFFLKPLQSEDRTQIIGHVKKSGYAAGRSRGSSSQEIFLVLFLKIAQMDVDIDQSRQPKD